MRISKKVVLCIEWVDVIRPELIDMRLVIRQHIFTAQGSFPHWHRW